MSSWLRRLPVRKERNREPELNFLDMLVTLPFTLKGRWRKPRGPDLEQEGGQWPHLENSSCVNQPSLLRVYGVGLCWTPLNPSAWGMPTLRSFL